MGKAKRPATPMSSKSTAPDVPTATRAAAGIGATRLIKAPPSDLDKLVKRTSWTSGEIIHRVHLRISVQ